MRPTDFPIEHLANLERGLINSAAGEHAASRQAAGHDTPALQHGHAEAAFAYLSAARDTNVARDKIIAELDRIASRQDDPHTWPIDRLSNLDDELGRDRSEKVLQRYPLWGVPAEHRTQDAYLGVLGSTRDGEILLYTLVGSDASDGDFLNVDIENWRALNQLVERVAAGKPVPYNNAGDVHAGGNP